MFILTMSLLIPQSVFLVTYRYRKPKWNWNFQVVLQKQENLIQNATDFEWYLY